MIFLASFVITRPNLTIGNCFLSFTFVHLDLFEYSNQCHVSTIDKSLSSARSIEVKSLFKKKKKQRKLLQEFPLLNSMFFIENNLTTFSCCLLTGGICNHYCCQDSHEKDSLSTYIIFAYYFWSHPLTKEFKF